ncbi:hypothetical protein Tco_1137229 [Tanacetum coccineum]
MVVEIRRGYEVESYRKWCDEYETNGRDIRGEFLLLALLMYKLTLTKAVDTNNLHKQYFVLKREDNNKITAAHLPYFDGAYWLGAVESMSKKLEEEEGLGKLWIKSPNKPTLKALGQDNPTKDVLVMQQVMDEEDTIYKLDKALHEPSRFIIQCYTIVGIIHVGRDMYDRVPQGNVGDDQGSNLLKNCYNALPDGKVILIEAILPFLSVISSATKVIYSRYLVMRELENAEKQYLNCLQSGNDNRVDKVKKSKLKPAVTSSTYKSGAFLNSQ